MSICRAFSTSLRKAARRFHGRYRTPVNVPCFSVAGDPAPDDVCWPLKRFHAVLLELEGPNDGLVSVASANAFGSPLPNWPVDHLRQMNWLVRPVHGPIGRPPLELHAAIVDHLASLGFGRRAGGPSLAQTHIAPSLASCSPVLDRVN